MASHPHFIWNFLFRNRNQEQKTLEQILKENTLFCTLSSREIKYLSRCVYDRTYQVNETIFQQNDRGVGMYLIIQGKVLIKVHTPHGETDVTELQNGSFFGEIALVDPRNLRTASAIALEPTQTVGFFKPDLVEILDRKPEMGVKIMTQLSMVLAQRLTDSLEVITELSKKFEGHPSKIEELKTYENRLKKVV